MDVGANENKMKSVTQSYNEIGNDCKWGRKCG